MGAHGHAARVGGTSTGPSTPSTANATFWLMEAALGILVERGGPHAPASLMVDASRSLAPPPRDQEPTGFCNVQDGSRGGGRHSSSSYTPLLPIQLISHIWYVEAWFVCCVRQKMFCVPCVCCGMLKPLYRHSLLQYTKCNVCRWREITNNNPAPQPSLYSYWYLLRTVFRRMATLRE